MNDFSGGLIVGTMGGLLIGMYIFVSIGTLTHSLVTDSELIIANVTAQDICFNLTNNSAVSASVEDGRLVCSLPTYDHTQNIVIRENGQRR